VAGWYEESGTRIVIGSSNYEQGNPNVASAYIHTVENGQTVRFRKQKPIKGWSILSPSSIKSNQKILQNRGINLPQRFDSHQIK